jgi:Phage integrase, N-terminal SAM-like domain
MAGFIVKRVDHCQRKDGTKYKRTRWRAFIPDPTKPASSGAKIEKTFARKTGEDSAEAWLDEKKHSVKTGTYVSASKGKTPLRDVAAIWQATWSAKNLRPKTQRDYLSLLDNHVLPAFGDTPVSAISSVDVERWIAMLGRRQASPRRYGPPRLWRAQAVHEDGRPPWARHHEPVQRRVRRSAQ